MWGLSSDMAYFQIFAPLAKALPNLPPVNTTVLPQSAVNRKLSSSAEYSRLWGQANRGMNTSLGVKSSRRDNGIA